MGTISLLNLSFWGKLKTIIDVIPKIIYLLYACLASAVDALQALVRKLAGLDVYYQATTGEAVADTDPLTEFVYGILGFGNSAPLYDALNTVFWSFAIFGLIILVVSTMAAIIKSHYKEDSQGTSPWRYIYTAGKAIFTFALVPVLVIVGLQLSSFVLRTLDSITAGAGSEEEIVSMFGSSAVARFKSDTVEGSDTVTYGYYDFFGSGAPSTTTTFSGMLFKASAYSCNRVRTGGYSVGHMQRMMAGGGPIFGQSGSDFPSSGSTAEQEEYIAEQVDYLFANNIQLITDYSYWQVVGESNDVAPVWSVTDITGSGKSVVSSFSKYDTSFVWIFYDLWTFNYIIGFVGVFVTFGIMISIILGMMSRLIKGAALFLVYPALLGIAPLDDFKAFKGWGTQLMQQLMMAFGSILGINLLLLILPYVQNISFFNVGVIDAMIQLVMLVAGLLMAKDFISMINGFVGGADAISASEGAKGTIGGKLKAGIKPAAAIAGAGVRVGYNGVKAVGRFGVAAGKSIALKSSAWRAGRNLNKAEKIKNSKSYKERKAKYEEKLKEIEVKQLRDKRSGRFIGVKGNDKAQKAYDDAYDEAKKLGMTDEEASNSGKSAAKRLMAQEKFNAFRKDRNAGALKAQETKIRRKVEAANNIRDTYHLDQNYQKTQETFKMKGQNMKALAKGLKGDMVEAGMSLADGFLKAIKGFNGLMGMDKVVASAKEVLGESLSFRGGVFEENRKKRKEDKDKDSAAKKEEVAATNDTTQTNALKDIATDMKSLLKTMKSNVSVSRDAAKDIKNLSARLKTSSDDNSSSNNNNNGESN